MRAITKLQESVRIYLRTRPVRIIYLLDVEDTYREAILSAIFAECYSRYAGRQTLIVPVKQGVIVADYINWVRHIDPDVIYSYTPINMELLQQIEEISNPFEIIIHVPRGNDSFSPALPAQYLTSYSKRVHIEEKFHIPSRNHMRPLLIDIGNMRPWGEEKFITDNFGAYYTSFHGSTHYEEVSKYFQPLSLIGNESDLTFYRPLITAVLNYRDFFTRLIEAPYLSFSHLSSDTCYSKPNHYYDGSLNFHLIISNTFLDRLYFWNNRTLLPEWLNDKTIFLIVPREKIEDDQFIEPFIQFIESHFTNNYYGSSGNINLCSASLTIDELNAILNILKTKGLRRFARVNILSSEIPSINELRNSRWERFQNEDSFVLYENSGKFNVPPFKAKYNILPEGKWFFDLNIEKRDSDSNVYNSRDYWIFPRRNELCKSLVEGVAARINNNGVLSCTKETHDSDEITLNLPEKESVFHALFVCKPCYKSNDVRYSEHYFREIKYVENSDKGHYLTGTIGKFGNLDSAYQIINNHFWRTQIEALVARDPDKDEISDKIKKDLLPETGGKYSLETKAHWGIIAKHVIKTARDLKFPKKMTTYSALEGLWKAELEALKRAKPDLIQSEESFQDSVMDLRPSLEYLVQSKIFYQGFNWSCEDCKHRNWTSIKDVSTYLDCEVCGSQRQIPATFEWNFLLDQYFADSIKTHGNLPVIWTLGEILQKTHGEGFIFLPQSILFEGYPEENPAKHEIDIVCITSGKFLIGEVKTKARDFSDPELIKLVNICKIAIPDQVLISCIEVGRGLDKPAKTLKLMLVDAGLKSEVIIMQPKDDWNALSDSLPRSSNWDF